MSAALEALNARFRERCASDLRVIEAAVADPAQTASAEFAQVVHKLSGAAGTFGYADLSDLAGRVDDSLTAGVPPSPVDLAALVEGLRAV